MKKRLYYIAAAALLITGCAGEEADIFGESAAERLGAVSADYTAKLISAQGRWIFEYYPTSSNSSPTGLGYPMLLTFKGDESVVVAMNNSVTGNTFLADTSAWQVITDDGPVLTFNTYNKCMHAFSTPEDISSTSDSELGTGYGGDYEFIMVDVPSDDAPTTMMLKGKKRGVYDRLTRLDDGMNEEAYFDSVKTFTSRVFPSSAPNYDVLVIGDSLLGVHYASTGLIGLYPVGGDEVTEITYHPYIITLRGGRYYLRFRAEVEDSVSGQAAQEFVYDGDRFVSTGGDGSVIRGYDAAAFFYEELLSPSSYWYWNKSAEMSDSYGAVFGKVYDEMKSLSYTLNSLSFRYTGGSVVLRFIIRRAKGGNVNVDFNYSAAADADGVLLTYEGPVSSGGENLLEAVPSLSALLGMMSGQFGVKAGTTGFNLRTVRLTADDDSAVWFVVTYAS